MRALPIRYSELPDYRMGRARMILMLNDVAHMEKGLRYLDVGCGRAETLLHARQHGMDAWGTDIVPELIGDQIVEGDICDLPFEDNSFDYVSCYDVLEHLPPGTEQKALDELGRVCSRQLVLTTNDKPSHLPSGEDLHINKRPRAEWQADILARWNDQRVYFSTFGHMNSEWKWRIVFQ
jgi:ubiquinone/menaquinone biosynthesis C-methylase UbiE